MDEDYRCTFCDSRYCDNNCTEARLSFMFGTVIHRRELRRGDWHRREIAIAFLRAALNSPSELVREATLKAFENRWITT